jgi:hypothetical protein
MQQLRLAERVEELQALWCVAVGVPLGCWVDHRGDAGPGVLIRQGSKFLVAEPSMLKLFLPALSPKPIRKLLEIARDAGADDASDLLVEMVDQGLLAVLGRGRSTDRETLRRLRLQTVGLGMGNNRHHPDSFLIVSHPAMGEPDELLTCDFVLYSVWAGSDGRTLGEVSERLAGGVRLKPDAILDHVLEALPSLLGAGVAFLDAASTEGSA